MLLCGYGLMRRACLWKELRADIPRFSGVTSVLTCRNGKPTGGLTGLASGTPRTLDTVLPFITDLM
mgnify:CR=1 FL=1